MVFRPPIRIKLEFRYLGFLRREGNRGTCQKNSQSKGENCQQSQHCVTRDSNPGLYWWQASCSRHFVTLASSVT